MAISKRTRIAIVAASAPPLSSGGVASAHYNLFRALRRSGYNAQLFTFFDNGKLPKLKEAHVVRHGAPAFVIRWVNKCVSLVFKLLDPQKKSYQTADILRSFLGAQRMGAAIRRFQADVIVLSDHGAPGLWVSKRKGQRFLLVSHHNPMRFAKEPVNKGFSLFDARVAVWLENIVLKKIDLVICPSNYILAWFKKTYVSDAPVRVIPNLVDTSYLKSVRAFPLRKNLDLDKETKIVYLPSAGTTHKGARFVWPITQGLLAQTKTNILFYMPGEVEAALMDLIEAKGVRDLFFLPGQVEYGEHLSYVKACDFGISPALMENLSMAILEAVMLGVPMLAFVRGGNADIIEGGQNGYLIKPFETADLIAQAKKLANSQKLSEFKTRTKLFSARKFKTEALVAAYLLAMDSGVR